MKRSRFTLIEVLVAMGIFMIGVAPVLGLMSSTTRIHQNNVRLAQVTSFSDSILRDMALYNYQETWDDFKTDFRVGEKFNLGDNQVATDPDYAMFKKYHHLDGVWVWIDHDKVGLNSYLIVIGIGPTEPTGNSTTQTAKANHLHQFSYLFMAK